MSAAYIAFSLGDRDGAKRTNRRTGRIRHAAEELPFGQHARGVGRRGRNLAVNEKYTHSA